MDFCDKIYIYDNNSTDGSLEVYASNPKCVVVRSTTNNFEYELVCKRILLKKLISENPEVQWICWTDVDTLLDARLVKDDAIILRDWLKKAGNNGIDGIKLGHYNLWKSETHYRLDNSYHCFHEWGRIPFWRNNGRLEFPAIPGLHQSQEPKGLDTIIRIDYNLVHRGFASESQIRERYEVYKSKGQSGPDLDRLIDESNLWLEAIPQEVYKYVQT
jgi:hypothetical protein